MQGAFCQCSVEGCSKIAHKMILGRVIRSGSLIPVVGRIHICEVHLKLVTPLIQPIKLTQDYTLLKVEPVTNPFLLEDKDVRR